MRCWLLLSLAFALAGAAQAEPRPAVATRALMRDLVSGRRAWASLIDPAAGVFDLGYRTGDFDGDVRWGRVRCDGRFLIARRRQLAAWIEADEVFRCQNRAGRHTCWLGEAGEWSPTLRFEFRATPTGLVLTGVAEINSVYNPADQERVLTRLEARAHPTVCDG